MIDLCIECHNPERAVWSRGLCNTCYSAAQRGGYLNDYPTKSFMEDPESYVRWAFAYFPELVVDVSHEFGNVRFQVGPE